VDGYEIVRCKNDVWNFRVPLEWQLIYFYRFPIVWIYFDIIFACFIFFKHGFNDHAQGVDFWRPISNGPFEIGPF